MANAKKCDCCKDFYIHNWDYEYNYTPFTQLEGIRFVYSQDGNNRQMIGDRIDLCDACIEKVLDVLGIDYEGKE